MWAKQQLKSQDTRAIVRDAREYALHHGLVLRYLKSQSPNHVGHIPFTLFPTTIPTALYNKCLALQPTVNKLMLGIANDSDFMLRTLEGIIKVDSFTENLVNIQKAVTKEGLAQPVISCISRADYMVDKISHKLNDLQIRQVEVNAIASSMSAHSNNTQLMHEFLMSKYNIKLDDSSKSIVNEALEMVARSLIDAFDAYGKPNCRILVVEERFSPNFSDYSFIEQVTMKMRPDIKFDKRPFNELPSTIRLGPNKELLHSDKEVAVVYYRYCYDPSNYDFDGAWEARLLMERSRAIKCPSINFHLAGAKKFQQVLNSPDELEHFLEPLEAEEMSSVFCKFWSIDPDNPKGEEGFKIGLAGHNNLVLKPQREGGGHNIFGSDIPPFLANLSSDQDRLQYILMEYIDSPTERNWILFPGEDSREDMNKLDSCDELVSELGIFGGILGRDNTMLSSRSAGYLVRSKILGIMEGGVSSGYAGISSLIALDSPK